MLIFVVFFALALIILLPLLAPGYILTFDLLAVPFQGAFPATGSPDYLFNLLWVMGNKILPSFWLQKGELFAVFFLAGWGMARLIKAEGSLPKFFGGLFYAVNPFVYERVVAGHWNLLLGYSLFPWVIAALKKLIISPGLVNAVVAALVTTILISVSMHYVLIFAFFLGVYLVVYFIASPKIVIRLVAILGVFALFLLIGSFHWVAPLVTGQSALTSVVGTFNQKDLAIFQSQPDPGLGQAFNLISGYGLWTEAYHYFVLPKDFIFFWPVISIVFLALTAFGLWSLYHQQHYQWLLGFVIALTAVMATDIAAGVPRDLYRLFPFLLSFREPQKLIGLTMLAIAFLGAYGLEFLIRKKKFFLVLVILPLIYTPTVFGGFWGQLQPALYPSSWSYVRTTLIKDKNNYLTLFFPWHQYLRLRFNNDWPVANPAPMFFGSSILSSQNYETKVLYSHETRPEALHVEGLLRMQRQGVNLLGEKTDLAPSWAEGLSVINVKYLILAKDDDWQDYLFLDSAPGLLRIYDDETMVLYQNLNWQNDKK